MSLGRLMASFLLLAVAVAIADPPLTTIQDTIYKADGTRMNATAVITWFPFEASDQSAVGMQSVTVPIVNGSIYVQLVPNTTATPSQPYTVTYSSDGMNQFTETWMVPPSISPLRLRDVRTGTTTGGNGSLSGSGGVTGGPVPESGVTGLLADLSSRPLKGSLYSPGRVAIVDPTGALATVAGNFNDCVYVNGTSGPCFDATQLPSYADAETPAGVVDGANSTFALAASPSPSQSLILFRNGMAQKPGFDFNLSGSEVQFVSADPPQPGDTLMAWYRRPSSASGPQGGNLGGPPAFATMSAQVICSTGGGQTSAITLARLGSCTLPAGFLAPGDRVEIHFLFAHAGTASGYTVSVSWGTDTIIQRTAGSADLAVSGKTEAMISASATHISGESFGSVLPFLTALSSSTVSNAAPIVVLFQGALTAAGTDTLALANATVIRYPAVNNP